MLQRLHVRNFTVFADADFQFEPGLNVIVGTNGIGKSHVLKLGYAVDASRYDIGKKTEAGWDNELTSRWDKVLFNNINQVFQVDNSRNLVRVAEGKSYWKAELAAQFYFSFDLKWTDVPTPTGYNEQTFNKDLKGLRKSTFDIKFEIQDRNLISMANGTDKEPSFAPVFIPAKELLTLSWMLPASEQLDLPVERNYLDLLRQLRGLPLRKPDAAEAINALSEILGGQVREESGKYYLVNEQGHRTEMNLVAEGLRKFGTLQKLLSNGSLTPKTTLFWDEPEANLNPALLRKLAAVLSELARQGFQIVLATHSLFLLKQLHILSRQKDTKKLPVRYFGLNVGKDGATTVVTKDDFELLPDIVALDEELEQADELEDIFANEDRSTHAAD